MDLDKYVSFCRKHHIGTLVYVAIKDIDGINIEPWKKLYAKSAKRYFLFEIERNKLLDFMNSNNIWYMLLKGIVIQKYYPVECMREMSDNDILYDTKYTEKVKEFMTKEGFKPVQEEGHHSYVYFKKPIFNFEMHDVLYTKDENETFYEYYKNIEDKLVKNGSERCFTKDDFYIYQIVHHYLHDKRISSGLRPLIDIYVYTKANDFNYEYIEAELKKLKIDDFEKKYKQFAYDLFEDPNNPPNFNDEDTDLINDILSSSTYGSFDVLLKRRKEQHSNSGHGFLYYLLPPRKRFKEEANIEIPHAYQLPKHWIKLNRDRIKTYGFKNLVKSVWKK